MPIPSWGESADWITSRDLLLWLSKLMLPTMQVVNLGPLGQNILDHETVLYTTKAAEPVVARMTTCFHHLVSTGYHYH